MHLSNHPSTPARLVSPGASKLPRSLLIAVGLLYILAGLIFRDPWKTDDVAGLAAMLTAMQESGNTLLLPQIGSLAYAENGPLVTWVGVACIKLFSPVLALFTSELDAIILASRIPNLLWFGLVAFAIWGTTFHLARRPEAQPLALPFGGEPPPDAYGRMLADAALLFFLATVGVIWRMHESSEVPAIIAFQTLALYALARFTSRPNTSSLLLGFSLGAALLTRGVVGGLPILLTILALFSLQAQLRRESKWLALSLILALSMFLLWWFPASNASGYWTEQWLLWNRNHFAWPYGTTLSKSLRDLAWFLWPTWPLALLALWNWRAWLRTLHIAVPYFSFLSALLVIVFSNDPFEPEFALLAVPSAILAAFALPTLRRGVINVLDWFAVMCFSLTAATVWLGWVALQSGWPPKIAHSIARQTAGFDNSVTFYSVLIAVLGSVAWVALVVWRTRRHPPGLWRGTVLSAGGLLITWLLLVTLWLPALNYARSYRAVSHDLAEVLAEHQGVNECVRGQGISTGQRASFYAFNHIDLKFDRHCVLTLEAVNYRRYINEGIPAPEGMVEIWSGRRGGDRYEIFRLLRRAP